MLETLTAEFSRQGGPDLLILAIRLIGTAFLCGVIGWEREMKRDTAGLRTNILVGLASAAFAFTTLALLETAIGNDDSVRADPLRLVEAVTNGVAFLAAGIVIFTKGKVRGLTTGAGLWVSASIGLAVGLGFWNIAVLTTLAGFFVLRILQSFKETVGIADEK